MYRKFLGVGVCVIALGMAIGILVQPVISGDELHLQTNKFSDVLNYITRNYVEEIQPSTLVEAAVRSMLGELDPHSVYIPPENKKKNDEDFRGNFEGIGIRYKIIKDTITVIVPIIGGPGDKLGLQCNDKIVSIDDESAVGLKIEDLPKKLKGPAGTKVTVTVKRENTPSLLHFDITRGQVPILSVEASYMIPHTDIGYIYVSRFAATTHNEVVTAARKLREEGAKNLVLDLRWNPGGYLDQAYRIADEFVRGGKKIVYRIGRKPEFSEDYFSTNGGELEDLPLAVLINASSASASEIVSGAIQDLDRGLIVGETSFGKGLVQQQYDLPDGSAFRLTNSRYYTPSGRSIQRSYVDKQKYYALEGRADVSEGENVSHTGEEDSTRPAFKTIGGRTVYGGGGIVPDYVVKRDTVSKFRYSLSRNNAYGDFIESYILESGNAIREQYHKSLEEFIHKFEVTDGMISSFKKMTGEKGIAWDEVQYRIEEKPIKASIKGLILEYIWNTSTSFVEAFVESRQVDKAVELLPEAAKIANLN